MGKISQVVDIYKHKRSCHQVGENLFDTVPFMFMTTYFTATASLADTVSSSTGLRPQ